jgi:ribosome biogenesis protein UTP30
MAVKPTTKTAAKATTTTKATKAKEAPVAEPVKATKETVKKVEKVAPKVADKVPGKVITPKTADKVTETVTEKVPAKTSKQTTTQTTIANTGFASKIKPDTITKSVKALRAFLSNETGASKKLIQNEGGYFEIQINLKKAQIRPTQISIPLKTSIYKRPGVTICLFTKDPQDQWEEYLINNPVVGVTRVLSVKKLGSDFKPFQHRRLLLQQHDLFLADAAIVPMMKQLLGKTFYEGTKAPIKVNLSKRFKTSIQSARDSTHFTIPKGQTFHIRIGHADLKDDEIIANIIDFLPKLQKVIPTGIGSVLLKTEFSASIPLYVNLATKTDFVATMEEQKTKIAKLAQNKIMVEQKRAAGLKLSVSDMKKAQSAATRCQMTLKKYLKIAKQRGVTIGTDVDAPPAQKQKEEKTMVEEVEVEKPAAEVKDTKKVTAKKAPVEEKVDVVEKKAPVAKKVAAVKKAVVAEEKPVKAAKEVIEEPKKAVKRKAAPTAPVDEPVIKQAVKKTRK